jgi:hypothetical protein
MRLFKRHFLKIGNINQKLVENDIQNPMTHNDEVLCDEDLIERSLKFSGLK